MAFGAGKDIDEGEEKMSAGQRVYESLMRAADTMEQLLNERNYLRRCLNEILTFAPEYLIDEGGNKYVPGWLQNARDAAAGKIKEYPET